MENKRFITTEYITSEDIKKIRKQMGLTQKEFAELVSSSKSTIERWETSSEHIRGPIALVIKMLERYPEYLKEIS